MLLYRSQAELVMPEGYPLEEYEVVTADGYILTVFRIPYGKNSTSTPRRPILLQHGIFATSASWVISEPHKGLGSNIFVNVIPTEILFKKFKNLYWIPTVNPR